MSTSPWRVVVGAALALPVAALLYSAITQKSYWTGMAASLPAAAVVVLTAVAVKRRNEREQ
jgi:hypothetical protein